MATLLQGVNAILKRVQIIKGDTGELSSLSNNALQNYIDTSIQVWNEIVGDLYSLSDLPMPNELAESTITLVNGQRAYQLASDLNQLHYPLIDETNGQYITDGGNYMTVVTSQPFPNNETGLPRTGVFRPTDGYLYLDRIPTSAEAGRVYKYRYDKDLELNDATDTFPFNDVVFRALLPAAKERWKLDHNKSYEKQIFDESMAIAAKYLVKKQRRTSWGPVRVSVENITDPMRD